MFGTFVSNNWAPGFLCERLSILNQEAQFYVCGKYTVLAQSSSSTHSVYVPCHCPLSHIAVPHLSSHSLWPSKTWRFLQDREGNDSYKYQYYQYTFYQWTSLNCPHHWTTPFLQTKENIALLLQFVRYLPVEICQENMLCCPVSPIIFMLGNISFYSGVFYSNKECIKC